MKLLGTCSVNELMSVTTFVGTQIVRRCGETKGTVQLAHIEQALDEIPTGPSSMVDQPKIPNVRWTDIGGAL